MTEISGEKQKILIVSKKNYQLVNLLKSALKKYESEIFFSAQSPKSLEIFDYCFFINEETIPSHKENQRLIFIFFNKEKQAKKFLNNISSKIKIIDISADAIGSNDIDRVLWFSFSGTKEKYLKLSLPKIHKTGTASHQKYWQKLKFFLNPKRLIILFISIFILIHLLFIPPLIGSFVFIYRAFLAFKQEDFKTATSSLAISMPLLKASKKIYGIIRPTYLLFSLALPPDNFIDIAEKIQNVANTSYQMSLDVKEVQKLLFKEDKTSQEKAYLTLRLEKLKNGVTYLEENLEALNQKILSQFTSLQTAKIQLSEITDGVSKLKKILEHLDTILAKGKELKYLIFFANNMELRPGGGFLGSFGIVNVKDYTIEDIKVYDVYDADGQLTAHIEPPEAIRKYLNMPHWFLRDSNFSPDFLENYIKAQFFLEKEMGISDFAGSILITTTSIEQILSAFGDIYLPDFGEYVNNKNFYLKAQIHSEKGFFPGSIQKKTFLSTLTRQIVINLDRASFGKLATGIKKSLDEKQIVLYFDEPKLQELINLWYWSGRLIEPRCSQAVKNCLTDYLFPYDANVGANKANFFINRSFVFKTDVDSKGAIHHLLFIQYKNDSPGEVFPGGTYRNFFQILLPKDVIIKRITKDGVAVEEFTEKTNEFKNIGFFFEVPPKKTVEIKIDYQLAQVLEKGKQIYQLIAQKQIGSSNNDLTLEFNLPKNTYLVNQNFSPLVKGGNIIYNTTFATDKIFFVELTKE